MGWSRADNGKHFVVAELAAKQSETEQLKKKKNTGIPTCNSYQCKLLRGRQLGFCPNMIYNHWPQFKTKCKVFWLHANWKVNFIDNFFKYTFKSTGII